MAGRQLFTTMAIKNIPAFFGLKTFGKFFLDKNFSGNCLFGKTIRVNVIWDNGIRANVRSGKKISVK